ncbi:GHKL domain-containing protein [Lacticaseibacillus pantheris]
MCVYIIEYVFEKMNLALTADWFVTGIFVFMVIINFGSLYFLYHDIKINVENKLLRSSEQAKQQYYADLELQQTHTRKVLHDYKNVLAALQLSLDKDAPAEATMQTRQVIESAQATLNDIQPNNSALSMITTLPLRSLLYLKWTEASNKGVRLNIQSDGTVTISNNTDLLDVLRVVGILVDNAVEAATGGEEADVLLTQSASELAITVVNTVSANFTLSNLSQSGYTTKGEGHGNGLDNLRNVLRHNAHLKLMRRVTGMKLSITLVVEVA